MFGSAVLDVAIGLVFVYLSLALICTALNEWWAGIHKSRARTLQEGIRRLLHANADPSNLADKLYAHPLIRSASRGPGEHPSYIAPATFALTLMDLVGEKKHGTSELENLSSGISKLPEGPVKHCLSAVLQDADPRRPAPQQKIEEWFSSSMDRVSGWYKRRLQITTAVLAAIVVIIANADTVKVAKRLWQDPTLRAAIAEQAGKRTRMNPPEYTDPDSPIPSAPVKDPTGKVKEDSSGLTQEEQAKIGELLNWTAEPERRKDQTWLNWLLCLIWVHLPGWVVSIIAVSLGAPFWFDLLQKIMKLRSAGTSPSEKPKTT